MHTSWPKSVKLGFYYVEIKKPRQKSTFKSVLTDAVFAIDGEKISRATGAEIATNDVLTAVFTASVLFCTLVYVCSTSNIIHVVIVIIYNIIIGSVCLCHATF